MAEQEDVPAARIGVPPWNTAVCCSRYIPGQVLHREDYELLKGPRRPYHHVRLNHQFKADLGWWKAFADGWNGVALFRAQGAAEATFASDASGGWGCGAWCDDQWWQLEWPTGNQSGIAFKELFAVRGVSMRQRV